MIYAVISVTLQKKDMEDVLKYDIIIEGEGIFECKLETSEEGIIAYIFTPAGLKNWQQLFIENMINNENGWAFSKRNLPVKIINLEKELSVFIGKGLN
jgi:hypothetical protein